MDAAMLGTIAFSMPTRSAPILLLVDRGDLGHYSLHKAMLLARHMQAPLELHLCEVLPVTQARNSQPHLTRLAQVQTEARAYLQALRQNILSTDVEIRCESQVAPSLADGLDQRLRGAGVLLVITPVGAQIVPDLRVAMDWSLLQSCSAPLLLTRKRAWRPVPQFGAAIDLDADADDELGARLIDLAERLSRRCVALLEYLYVAPGDAEGALVQAAQQRLAALAGATNRNGALHGWLHYHPGQPREVLPRVVSERCHDLLMMGWPRRPEGFLTNFVKDAVAASSESGVDSGSQAAPLEDAAPICVRLLWAAEGDLLLLPAVSDVH